VENGEGRRGPTVVVCRGGDVQRDRECCVSFRDEISRCCLRERFFVFYEKSLRKRCVGQADATAGHGPCLVVVAFLLFYAETLWICGPYILWVSSFSFSLSFIATHRKITESIVDCGVLPPFQNIRCFRFVK
jgi:hypothetical protein